MCGEALPHRIGFNKIPGSARSRA